ncbi:MAG: PspA/IM30 family protein [Zoogloeaceae bacterium]|jgi:phage shock protein A|nr:PspA/IM30 family protein [Zoogloeaceae bacterium]
MSVIGKLVTLLRGSVRELGESIVDANGVKIYEQEIADAKAAIAQAKTDLAGILAKEMQSTREIARLKAEVERLEGLAVEALDKQKEDLAEEVAGQVAATEGELDRQTQMHAEYSANGERLRDLIKASEEKIREHERAVQMTRATENVYQATRSISESIGASGSKLMSAKESLERIKKRHEDLADRIVAAETLDKEFSAKALEEKLAAAGIGEEPKRKAAVIARIRARQTRAEAPKPLAAATGMPA